MPSSYAVGPHFEALIQRLLESGRYANASEIVRAGLRLLEEHEADLAARRAALLVSVEEAIRDVEAGRGIPAEQVFAEVRQLIRSRRAGRDAAE